MTGSRNDDPGLRRDTGDAAHERDAGRGSRRGEPDRIRRLYRRLLSLYPAAFRERYGADLLQVFDDRRREPQFRRLMGGIRLVLFLLRDFVTSMPMAYDQKNAQTRWEGTVNNLLRDFRYAVRMLVKNPMFTIAAVITLALGIGLNAATFSAVRGLLLRPLDGVREPERLVQLYRKWPGMDYGSTSIPHYQDLRDRTGEVFSDVAAWNFVPMSLSADGRSERLMGMLVSADFFQTYGVRPALGRFFTPGVEDRDPGAHPVAVLGHGFWQSRFGADPSVVGRTVILNGQPFEVVGVAPADFRGPMSVVDVPLYVPLMEQMVVQPAWDFIHSRGNNSMTVVARLRDHQTVQRAHQVLDAILTRLREEYPDDYKNQIGTTLVPQMQAGIHPAFRTAQVGMSAVMMVVVSLLLVIACVNVANLFLARARERRREMGIRLSLGAGRGRIVQQLLMESVLFSIVAGLAGLGLAQVAVRLLSTVRPPMDGPWSFAVGMDRTVLLYTFGVTLATVLVFGLVPALQSARSDTVEAVKGATAGRTGRSRMNKGLVVVQMALSLVLLVSSGLFLRSLQGATRIDPGFADPAHVALASADPGLQGYDGARARAFWDRTLDEVRALPDVTAAGLINDVPLGLSGSDRGVTIAGYEFSEGEQRTVDYAYVTEGYFEAMGVHVLEGRSFTRQDDQNGAPAIIVNQRFAEHFWPGESALGRTVNTAGKDRQVVGVVETGKYRSLGEPPTDFMFFPERELFQTGMTVVARVKGDPQVVMRRVREIVRAEDPDLPVFDVRTMEDFMGIALMPARLGGSVLGLFGLLGLVLAAVGVYGVMAYSVSQRKRELGIRVALGADRSSVVGMVLGEGLRLTLLGAVIGLAAAAAAAKLVAGLLYGVSALDPVAFAGVPLLLLGVAALAVYLPARRAAGVDPMRVLKTE
ncbi:MAG: ABC transporter permease [Gemmatimonadetes bacterium]|nr:ABC transporter permease [Gemmatimonadota bacterium]